jgi:thioredoxin-related protein
MKILLVLIIAFFGSSNWSTDFENAKKEAITNQKLILLNFSGSDWCGPCIKLKKEILDTEEFINYSEKCLVLIRADFPRAKKNQLTPELKKANEALAEKYNNKGKFPFTVLIDAKGKVLKEWEGYPKGLNTAIFETEIAAIVDGRK